MSPHLRVGLSTLLWTSAFLLMVVRTFMRHDTDLAFITGWAVLCGMAAMVITGYHLLMSERNYCRAVAESAAASALKHHDGDHLRSLD